MMLTGSIKVSNYLTLKLDILFTDSTPHITIGKEKKKKRHVV
jgi:hypothetical protein